MVQRKTRTICLRFGLFVVLTLSSVAFADDGIKVETSSREVEVNEAVVVRVTIQDQDDTDPPTIPSIQDCRVMQHGGPSRSSQVSFINGRRYSEESVSWTYTITPEKEGMYVIPPITAMSGGREVKSDPLRFICTKPGVEGDLLLVDLYGSRDTVYVGEELEVILRVWIRPYSDSQYDVTIDESNMWSLIDLENSDWGPFAETLQDMYNRRRRPSGETRLRKDTTGTPHEYYVYLIAANIRPDKPGQLSASDVLIQMDYPTRLGKSNSLFDRGRLSITGSKRVSAAVTSGTTEVKDVPSEGRPEIYRGAVGRYSIETSVDTEKMRVGDPIMLNVTLTGKSESAMKRVQPPPLAKISALTEHFQVPDENIAGQVKGNQKVFTQRIRAKNAGVTEIPPIPFAFFDPMTEKYVTVHSEPIPISVEESEKMNTSDIVAGDSGPARSRRLTEVGGGIVANYENPAELIVDQTFKPHPIMMGILIAPPAFWMLCWFLSRRSNRLQTDTAYARRRSALKHATQRIDQSRRTEPERAADAVTGYIADRCNIPSGGLTATEAVAALKTNSIRQELIVEVCDFLESCENIRYSGGAEACGTLPDKAATLVSQLEREKF